MKERVSLPIAKHFFSNDKTAIGIQTFETRDSNIYIKYKPKALLFNISKIIEKLLKNRIADFFLKE